MQVTVDVTDEIRREAESRSLPVIDFVELLIQRAGCGGDSSGSQQRNRAHSRSARSGAGPKTLDSIEISRLKSLKRVKSPRKRALREPRRDHARGKIRLRWTLVSAR